MKLYHPVDYRVEVYEFDLYPGKNWFNRSIKYYAVYKYYFKLQINIYFLT